MSGSARGSAATTLEAELKRAIVALELRPGVRLSEAELAERHQRYLRLTGTGEARVFVILDDDDAAAGSINRWSTTWRGTEVYETGWFVAPELQGRGIARAAVKLVVADAAEYGDRDLLTAFPAVDNAASNALCRSAGFRLDGTDDIVFRGTDLHVNAWTLDLAALRGPRPR